MGLKLDFSIQLIGLTLSAVRAQLPELVKVPKEWRYLHDCYVVCNDDNPIPNYSPIPNKIKKFDFSRSYYSPVGKRFKEAMQVLLILQYLWIRISSVDYTIVFKIYHGKCI